MTTDHSKADLPAIREKIKAAHDTMGHLFDIGGRFLDLSIGSQGEDIVLQEIFHWLAEQFEEYKKQKALKAAIEERVDE